MSLILGLQTVQKQAPCRTRTWQKYNLLESCPLWAPASRLMWPGAGETYVTVVVSERHSGISVVYCVLSFSFGLPWPHPLTLFSAAVTPVLSNTHPAYCRGCARLSYAQEEKRAAGRETCCRNNENPSELQPGGGGGQPITQGSNRRLRRDVSSVSGCFSLDLKANSTLLCFLSSDL